MTSLAGAGPWLRTPPTATQSEGITLFRWSSLSTTAADHLGEPILAATPVSPVPRRAPGFGAWGHEPLVGAQVRYLVVTATRVVVYSLDRDLHGPELYRLTRVEIETSRDAIRGVELDSRWFSRLMTVVFRDGTRWNLEVSLTKRDLWGPVRDELGQLAVRAEATVPSSA